MLTVVLKLFARQDTERTDRRTEGQSSDDMLGMCGMFMYLGQV